MLVAAAGPASNLVLAVVAGDRCWRCCRSRRMTLGEPNVSAPLASLLSRRVQLNVLLAVFNMLPIPPLDGGNVLGGLLPPRARACVQPAAAVRLPAALRADAHRRLRATSCCRRTDFILSWLPT